MPRPVISVEPNSEDDSAEDLSNEEVSKQPPLPMGAALGHPRDVAWMVRHVLESRAGKCVSASRIVTIASSACPVVW